MAGRSWAERSAPQGSWRAKNASGRAGKVGRQLTVSAVGQGRHLDVPVRAQARRQALRVVVGDLIVLAAGHQQHGTSTRVAASAGIPVLAQSAERRRVTRDVPGHRCGKPTAIRVPRSEHRADAADQRALPIRGPRRSAGPVNVPRSPDQTSSDFERRYQLPTSNQPLFRRTDWLWGSCGLRSSIRPAAALRESGKQPKSG